MEVAQRRMQNAENGEIAAGRHDFVFGANSDPTRKRIRRLGTAQKRNRQFYSRFAARIALRPAPSVAAGKKHKLF